MKTVFLNKRALIIAFLLILTIPSFGQKDGKNITNTKRNKVEVSSVELRLRLDDFLVRYVGMVEEFTDQVYLESSDYNIKRAALMWRIYGISAMSKAINMSDPILSFYNGWPLTKQMVIFFETGPGQSTMGADSEDAIALCKSFESMFDSILVQTKNEEELQLREPFVDRWVEENPLESYYFSRPSTLDYFAKWIGEQQLGISGNVRTMTEEIQELSNRMNLYADLIPRQARWQAEYAMLNFFYDSPWENRMDDMYNNMNKLTEVVTQSPELIEDNRVALMKEIDLQRIETISLLRAERIAVINSISDERMEVFKSFETERTLLLNELKSERAIVMNQVDELSKSAIRNASSEMRSVIDVIFIRLLLLIILLGLLTFSIIYFFRRTN